MKRSRINAILRAGAAMIERHGFALPPFAHWTPDELRARAADGSAAHVIDARCGWDVTDYGAGRYDEMGLFLFTLRNGLLRDLQAGHGMAYAEKLLISMTDQLSPTHTHIIKAEDIICRGVSAPGAALVVELHGSNADGTFAPDKGGTVWLDGVRRDYAPGERIRLTPGESVTLRPGDWHAFWGEGGDVLVGEVSTVNDDETDNVFREPIGRFATVEEDEAPWRLLVSDYPTLPRAANVGG